MTDDRELQVMAGVAAAVAGAALLKPRLLVRVLLADPDELGDIPKRTWALTASVSGVIVAAGLRRSRRPA